jgi:hypothetical protein
MRQSSRFRLIRGPARSVQLRTRDRTRHCRGSGRGYRNTAERTCARAATRNHLRRGGGGTLGTVRAGNSDECVASLLDPPRCAARTKKWWRDSADGTASANLSFLNESPSRTFAARTLGAAPAPPKWRPCLQSDDGRDEPGQIRPERCHAPTPPCLRTGCWSVLSMRSVRGVSSWPGWTSS